MEKYYEYDGKLKKEMLKKWLKSQKGWKKRKKVVIILFIFAFIACIQYFFVNMIILKPEAISSLNVFGIVEALFVFLPFVIGLSMYTTGKKNNSKPYGSMTREFLFINDSGFQFGYHYTDEDDELNESMDVYQIPYGNITKIIFDDQSNILTVTGTAELIVYDDMQTGRINHYKSQRKFDSNSDYSFILSFKEQQEFLDAVNSRIPRLEN